MKAASMYVFISAATCQGPKARLARLRSPHVSLRQYILDVVGFPHAMHCIRYSLSLFTQLSFSHTLTHGDGGEAYHLSPRESANGYPFMPVWFWGGNTCKTPTRCTSAAAGRAACAARIAMQRGLSSAARGVSCVDREESLSARLQMHQSPWHETRARVFREGQERGAVFVCVDSAASSSYETVCALCVD